MKRLNTLGTKFRTAWALGLPNLGRVAVYRFGVRTGLHPVRRLRAAVPKGPFFAVPEPRTRTPPASTQWDDVARYFGWHPVPLPAGGCPDWHVNPLTGGRADGACPWWRIPDFDPVVGDIKAVWEASRLDWVPAMAQRAVAGRVDEAQRLNRWLDDWCARNPPFLGPNWKCGQEASIRVMHLAVAAMVLGQVDRPEDGLTALVRVHLQRIAPTLAYAMAQDNNHGTSEAAALFVGGGWLARKRDRDGVRWQHLGRKWLENRVARLIAPDGSFSQYSVNYHRVVLDTLAVAEVWRRRLGLPEFSAAWRHRAEAAARWLASLVDVRTGDAPNIGANDGARLLPLVDTDHRDYRPSVQLACTLFAGAGAYGGDGPWNAPLRWLAIAVPPHIGETTGQRCFDDGGYAVLRREEAMVVLRYPRFRFRPGHADALHVDLWLGGENLLRDAGTFSYSASADVVNAFAGVGGHTTVQFDGREPMPRMGRFLFGDWLKASVVTPPCEASGVVTCGAGWRGRSGEFHTRKLHLTAGSLRVTDQIGGFRHRAVFRWRLRPGPWRIEGLGATDGRHRVAVAEGPAVRRLELVPGWESRYYLQRTAVPVLEVEFGEPATVATEYRWFP